MQGTADPPRAATESVPPVHHPARPVSHLPRPPHPRCRDAPPEDWRPGSIRPGPALHLERQCRGPKHSQPLWPPRRSRARASAESYCASSGAIRPAGPHSTGAGRAATLRSRDGTRREAPDGSPHQTPRSGCPQSSRPPVSVHRTSLRPTPRSRIPTPGWLYLPGHVR